MIRDQKGQSLLEFALILPLLLLLICGIVDFGRILYTYMHVNLVAQEAVRMGGLGKKDVDIYNYSRNRLHIGDPSKLSITITPGDATRKSGDYVTVKLKYPVNYITPIVSQIIPSPYMVETDSTMRVE